MEETFIMEKAQLKKLKDGVLLTGLPGIGLIGQVVARYLVQEMKATKVASVFSPHFPHQVFMTKKGGMRLIKNSIYHFKAKNRDVLILLGDVQAMSSVGQYEVAGRILDYCQKAGVTEVLTVGGYSTGKIAEERRVFGVTTSDSLRETFKKQGVIFGEAKGSIVGAAGLLPALAKLRGIDGACLMGETHGSYVDTVSARQIAALLSKYLGFKLDLKRLDAQAEESQKVLKKVQEEVQKSMEAQFESTSPISAERSALSRPPFGGGHLFHPGWIASGSGCAASMWRSTPEASLSFYTPDPRAQPMKAQASLEYLALGMVSLAMLCVSVSALAAMKAEAERSFGLMLFSSSARAVLDAADEACAMGYGNFRQASISVPLNVVSEQSDDGSYVVGLSGAGGSLARRSLCPMEDADLQAGSVQVENKKGIIMLRGS